MKTRTITMLLAMITITISLSSCGGSKRSSPYCPAFSQLEQPSTSIADIREL